MANLCCTVNPKHTCRNCNEKICSDCTATTMPKYQWCVKCTELGDDFIGIIADQTNFIESIAEGADDLISHIDTIYDHPARCRTCKASEYCEDLQGLIADAGDASSKYDRVQRKIRGW